MIELKCHICGSDTPILCTSERCPLKGPNIVSANQEYKSKEIIKTEVVPGPVSVALDIRKELEEYKLTGNRTELVNILRDQFLLKRHEAASKSEEVRISALEILMTKIPDMSENMLLRVIDSLAKIGEIDIQTITGVFPGKTPAFALNQFIGTGGAAPMPAGVTQGNNSVKQTGEVLEALEHLGRYLKSKTIDHIEDK